MNRTLVAAAAILSCVGGMPAQAADPDFAIAGPAWDAVYFSMSAGGVWGGYRDVTLHAYGTPYEFGSFDSDGFVGVAGLGMNHQWGIFVFGVELEAEWSDRLLEKTVRQDWSGGIYSRLGMPIENFMPYLKAGPTFTHLSVDIPDIGWQQWVRGIGAGGGVDIKVSDTIVVNFEALYRFYPGASHIFDEDVAAQWNADDFRVTGGVKILFGG